MTKTATKLQDVVTDWQGAGKSDEVVSDPRILRIAGVIGKLIAREQFAMRNAANDDQQPQQKRAKAA
jgi:hypothetical protein